MALCSSDAKKRVRAGAVYKYRSVVRQLRTREGESYAIMQRRLSHADTVDDLFLLNQGLLGEAV